MKPLGWKDDNATPLPKRRAKGGRTREERAALLAEIRATIGKCACGADHRSQFAEMLGEWAPK